MQLNSSEPNEVKRKEKEKTIVEQSGHMFDKLWYKYNSDRHEE